ncbi:GtrA family protein [Streptomyces sp. SID13031]|uniref:GtrA family protein n=1 Tax=Streptomyces sp. SID13031 TaxID=2706046 RepID=UPI0013CD60B0|nr:GtrA family protein [Streptomyces sp. SID13031]
MKKPANLLTWVKYSASSLVATLTSEVAFLLCYWIGTASAVASVIAFAAGAVPNYVLNRRWAWRRQGRISARRELLPYAIIVLGSAAVVIAGTSAGDHFVRGWVDSHTWRTILAGAVFLTANAVTFILKFVLFDRYVFSKPVRTPATK